MPKGRKITTKGKHFFSKTRMSWPWAGPQSRGQRSRRFGLCLGRPHLRRLGAQGTQMKCGRVTPHPITHQRGLSLD